MAIESESLVERVTGVLRGRPGEFGVHARNLMSGEVVAVDADRVLPAESTVKTAILLNYERCIVARALDPKQRVDLVPERRFDGSGLLRYLDDGLSPTLDDLAWRLMIIVSDN